MVNSLVKVASRNDRISLILGPDCRQGIYQIIIDILKGAVLIRTSEKQKRLIGANDDYSVGDDQRSGMIL